MSRMMESGANWIPFGIVNGRNDFKKLSFNYPYDCGLRSWGSQTSSERHLIASPHLSAETTEVYSYFAQRKRCQQYIYSEE
jgi:hypothetical protein